MFSLAFHLAYSWVYIDQRSKNLLLFYLLPNCSCLLVGRCYVFLSLSKVEPTGLCCICTSPRRIASLSVSSTPYRSGPFLGCTGYGFSVDDGTPDCLPYSYLSLAVSVWNPGHVVFVCEMMKVADVSNLAYKALSTFKNSADNQIKCALHPTQPVVGTI